FVAIFIIIIIGFASIFQFYNLLHAYYWVAHTNKILSVAHEALYQVTNLESKQRGYLLFGDKGTVINYDSDILKIKKFYTLLYNLTKDNPAQQIRILKLSKLTDERINTIYQMIQLKINHKLYSTASFNAFQEGKKLSDEVKLTFQDVIDSEFELL